MSEVLTYKFGSGIALEGEEKRNALNFPLQVRACVSVPHAGLGAKRFMAAHLRSSQQRRLGFIAI